MAARAHIRLVEEPRPRPPQRKRRPRITYTVEFAPGGDPEKGEELLIRWLADLPSE